MSVLIDPEISVKRNLLKLIQSTNPDFNFATINHFVVKEGGVLTPTETVTVGGKSVVLDTWVKIQGVTIWGVEGEHVFKYKRCDITPLKDYGTLFSCWDYDAEIYEALSPTPNAPALSGSGDAGVYTIMANPIYFTWMTGTRIPITATKVLNKHFINAPKITLDGTEALIGNFIKSSLHTRVSSEAGIEGLLTASTYVALDGVSRKIYCDKPTKYLASYLNLHPVALLDERFLCYSNTDNKSGALAIKIGEDDNWFKDGIETSKFLYKTTLIVYTNYLDGTGRGFGGSLASVVTQASLDALRK